MIGDVVSKETVCCIGGKRLSTLTLTKGLVVRNLLKEKCHQAVRRGRKSFRWSPSDPSDTNRFHRRCRLSVCNALVNCNPAPKPPGNSGGIHISSFVIIENSPRPQGEIQKEISPASKASK